MISLITKQPGSSVVDLGCSNDPLTGKIAGKGYIVIGINDSEEMLLLAKKEYPKQRFIRGNAVNFRLNENVDEIFQMPFFTGLMKKASRLCCQIFVTTRNREVSWSANSAVLAVRKPSMEHWSSVF